MREPTPLFSFLGLSCYPYGAALALGLLLAALTALAGFRRAFGAAEDGLRLSLLALPLGFAGARLGYCAVKAGFIAVDFGPSFLYRFGLGGYSMVGAFVGVLAASALFGRITRRGWLPTMGAAMPALLLAAALGRFAECLTTEGIGEYVDNPFWQFFPFAVPDVYGDLRIPVFVWEGLTALVLCAVTWRCLCRPQDAALTGMLDDGARAVTERFGKGAAQRGGHGPDFSHGQRLHVVKGAQGQEQALAAEGGVAQGHHFAHEHEHTRHAAHGGQAHAAVQTRLRGAGFHDARVLMQTLQCRRGVGALPQKFARLAREPLRLRRQRRGAGKARAALHMQLHRQRAHVAGEGAFVPLRARAWAVLCAPRAEPAGKLGPTVHNGCVPPEISSLILQCARFSMLSYDAPASHAASAP